ncbi:GH3 auxin-responsive promoter family protein [Leptolyngbya cf. ectocarpi LEGE 11479]|uniref:GH3 auxin-responsive promoter family protein n=1 Tax=Leptolyngbya cf. ectocarpi LEGE 11479 TaxID=1828722 RepID=A0A929FAL1_LEPEC|nr:GH3 auxin-responsive promoter family protein [Leptolyngbya ectocarpi]MBE9068274.1 GH3 auxin-responsive promoter family protein [Leptolyngbya cf. ectocarpi LEGE 11479]
MVQPVLSVFAMAAQWQQRRFTRQLPQGSAIQARFLQTLLKEHQDTALGQALNLDQVSTLEDFRQQVPQWRYDDYAPYFERAAAGEANVVSPLPVQVFNMSSGSTGSRKLVPITKKVEQTRAYANQVAMGYAFAQAQDMGHAVGQLLLTTLITPLGQTDPGNITYGHVSGNQLRSTPSFVFQQLFIQPYDALLVSDTAARNYVCLLFGLRQERLAYLAANFPLIMLQLCAYLERFGPSLVDDIGRGKISQNIALDPALRQKLQSGLSPQMQRAKQLQTLLENHGRLLPRHVWPHLVFLITARGGPSDFYFERFSEYFGNTPIFGGTYSSSEAVFGSYYQLDNDGAILALKTNFFEFIAPDQWEKDNPKTLLPHQLDVGEYYRVLVTNYSGFCRYDIGDVVQVIEMRHGVPVIVFRYRQGGTLSAISEKTTEYHVVQVMAALQEQPTLKGFMIEDFCVTLSESLVDPFYVLNIELAGETMLPHPEQFLAAFDHQMQAANESYALKRKKNDIIAPQLNILAPGSFKQLRQRRLKPGVSDDAQVKLSHISCDRTLLDGLTITRQVRR